MSPMKFQEATSAASPCSYHVFLSFRGEDTRKTFTDHLYTALDQAGFRYFRDDDGIERGEDIKSELEKAIRESRISIIVLSKNYASSTWCLEELVMILKCRASGHFVLPVFYDVEPSEVRKQSGSLEEAFIRYEEKLKSETNELAKKKLKDKVGTWRAALREVADVAGMNLQNQVDGHEARFIQKIIRVVGDKLRYTTLNIAHHLVGIHSRVKNIQLWLEGGPSNVGIVAICGMGGIGKTTTAKLLYDLNFSRFEGSSFLENVRETSRQQDGLLQLQRKFVSDILKTRKVKLNSISEGIAMIKDAIICKKVFVVIDDVDKHEQLDALLGMQRWLFSGSKIIITTRCEQLLRASKFCKVHRVENLSNEESLELFSWHAFGKYSPNNGYGEVSKRVVSYCGGLPLAIEVLGSSLSGNCLNVWKSQLEKLKAIPDGQILEKLRISYDSLQDDHDKRLFLHLACFFVGRDKDSTVTILDSCEFYTVVGIQNLVDRCLISIDESNILVMHHLLQQMGREIVRQESPKEPSKRSILWNHKEAFNVLKENTGTSEIEGLKLDMCLFKEEGYASTVFGDNRKRHYEEYLGKHLLSNFGSSLKRYGFNIFSSNLEPTDSQNSNRVALEVDAFARMNKLKVLQLNGVHISGPYKKFPKGLRWLCWRGFPLESISCDFPLESLVALDMQYSRLKNVWEGTKFLWLLKILNLSHSYNLAKTPNFSELPNLERLVLKNCTCLVEVHESIGHLERLVFLNLEDCKNLRNLPRSICMLKHLETLVISGCSNLDGLPTNMGNMESLTVLKVDGIALNQSLPTNGQVNAVQSFIWPWRLDPRKSPKISWLSLPWSLVELSLANCNLSKDDFPGDLRNLFSLTKLDLSFNRFRHLPDFIKGLPNLECLHINHCPRLRELDGVLQVRYLRCGANRLLGEVTFQILHRPTTTCHADSCIHPETSSSFKLEYIENVEAEIINNLGLSNLQSMENVTVKLTSFFGVQQMGFHLQVCYETHIIYAYIPGNKVPPWFNFKNLGSSIDFIVSSYINSRIRGLNVCLVYELSGDPIDYKVLPFMTDQKDHEPHTVISNRTKSLIWSHCPQVFGTTEDGEDTMWLSYWKFGNHLESGDEVNISVSGGGFVQVKEVGVHLLYKEEQEEMSSQSAYEDKGSNQVYQFGNIVPGNVSAHQPTSILHQLGNDSRLCEYCENLYPPPWILVSPNYDSDLQYCWASALMAGRSFYVSLDPGR
ncbi:disease resistance protein RPV1-like [Rhododendron vialii]|uniref:disease resistance protein RPV1-like n=1 Tax=Rhododendron vialii TaxID=182163 RepID=UPI00265D6518|nr:disease resistance protein RPV1-like [Rhododendron vialii]